MVEVLISVSYWRWSISLHSCFWYKGIPASKPGAWKEEERHKCSSQSGQHEAWRLLHSLLVYRPRKIRTLLNQKLSDCTWRSLVCHGGDSGDSVSLYRGRVGRQGSRAPQPYWLYILGIHKNFHLKRGLFLKKEKLENHWIIGISLSEGEETQWNTLGKWNWARFLFHLKKTQFSNIQNIPSICITVPQIWQMLIFPHIYFTKEPKYYLKCYFINLLKYRIKNKFILVQKSWNMGILFHDMHFSEPFEIPLIPIVR